MRSLRWGARCARRGRHVAHHMEVTMQGPHGNPFDPVRLRDCAGVDRVQATFLAAAYRECSCRASSEGEVDKRWPGAAEVGVVEFHLAPVARRPRPDKRQAIARIQPHK